MFGYIQQGMDFNPRSCERSDGKDYPSLLSNSISIHAPARGATLFSAHLGARVKQFQSTLLREERLVT